MNNLIQDYELIGDKGYISADYQADLFNQSQIKLSVPTRKNQLVPVELSKRKHQKRKRMETLFFPQFKGQFSMNTNFAETFGDLATGILSKITALTMINT